MSDEPSIYRYERRLWLVVEGPHGIKQSRKIVPENEEALLRYAMYLKATGKSLPRQCKLLMTLKKLAIFLGPVSFKKASKDHIVRVLAKVQGSDYTRRDFQEITKQFFAWLYDVEDPRHQGYPRVVSWMRSKAPKNTLRASDLLTPQEVQKLIDATTDLRLKALIAVCYECGLRVGEALQLRLGDVGLEEQCAVLNVTGKTGPAFSLFYRELPAAGPMVGFTS